MATVSLYTLPYFCDPTGLPDTLPTSNKIEHAAVNLPTIRDPELDRIVLVNGCFVVKNEVHISENECSALLFLQKHQFIPAPKLYAMYYEASVCDNLSEDEKLHISRQLRAIWNCMRSIPSPTTSGMSGGPLRHRFFLALEPNPRITGPFETEEDLSQALEDAGWYPSYWEYAACFVDFEWFDDWPEKIECIVDPYPLESAMLRLVRQDLDY
ncbi:hypothetical protein GGR58DRAFT_517372 [Xylaria digitata]|nr:hypothetical protein GGR58DRAFT_517372 [Xylaria digitata]